MNDDDNNGFDPGADHLSDALRWQLHALRTPEAPSRDLWPGIAMRLPVAGLPAARADTRMRSPARSGRWLPLAVAASLLLAIGLLGVWKTAMPSSASDVGAAATLVQIEAAGLTRQYQAALTEVSTLPAAPELQPAIEELDRSAAMIREALDRDPDSRLLLEQLRRTYTQRLALARRTYS